MGNQLVAFLLIVVLPFAVVFAAIARAEAVARRK